MQTVVEAQAAKANYDRHMQAHYTSDVVTLKSELPPQKSQERENICSNISIKPYTIAPNC